MKKIKISLDTIMSVILIFLLSIYITGSQIHEILGIVFIILFTVHKLLNVKSIKIMLKQFLNGTCKKIVRNTVIVDILLTITMIISAVSGLFISKYIIDLGSENTTFWYITHTISSYLAVLIVIIHIYMHAKYIINSINKMFKTKYNRKQEYIFNSFIVICFILLINVIIKNDSINKIKTIYYLNKEENEMNNENNIIIIDDDENDQIDDTEIIGPSDNEIQEHLSGLRCNGCRKNCLLTNPQCMIGQRQAEEATEIYIENYVENKD